ncbi:PREDICTED: uncharacterized protein LOC108609864 [Drosophila arizonae]|uniref:Uncharacterized protein LOC108609864 n=1 Tax=Drosophila arizonae TaxID=7263 RepID=A0ABM1NQ88_DROAR|nr:PREDICTED: uncharacterized protein LOC108609864 [Drosophila arizonae]
MKRHSSLNSCYGVDRTQLLLQEGMARQNKGLLSVMDPVHPRSGDMKEAEVERIVRKTLLQMQDMCRFEDVDNIIRFAVPKVLYDLNALERLTLEVREMKEAYNSYIHHSKVMGNDLAEIFLDLHNIYTKLDQLDRSLPRRSREKREKQCKRLREAEHFLENAKHFIVKQKTPTPTPTVTSTVTPTATPTSSTHKQRKRDRLVDMTRSAERRAYLTNMIVVKKSDFSMELNRNKDFYQEAERVLRKKYCNKHGVP